MKLLRRYVNPQGPLPELKGQGNLLIIGGAACVWDDLRRYDEIHGLQDRMAVNDMMNYYPGPLQHGVGLHTDKLGMWSFNQAYLGPQKQWPPMQIHSHRPSPYVNHVWPLRRDGGTSGLFGVLIGLMMDYERIILAGITCDGSARFFEPAWQTHSMFSLPYVQEEWLRAKDEVPLFAERVRSLSGNTAKWLGEPDLSIEVPVKPPVVLEIPSRQPITLTHRHTPVTVITPTGDRPEAITLLRRWMARQTVKPDQWLIVDDGKTPLGKIHEAQVIRRTPRFDDEPCTLGINLQTAAPHISHDKILIMEDDDWYSPEYVETMTDLLDQHDLVGVAGTKCYHIHVPGYRMMGRGDHASLSQTGLRRSRLPQLLRACPGSCEVDMRLWQDFSRGAGLLIDGSTRNLHCALKGLPGRAGAGVGHIYKYHTPDPNYRQLKKWCPDWQAYTLPFRVKDRLVIYTAIAANGIRDDQLRDPDPIAGVDYVCFTDMPYKSNIWDIRPFLFTHPKEAVRTAKHPKILPHRYFPDYDLSVWVDGNIKPLNSVQQALEKYLADHHMALHRHPWRRGIYQEADVVMAARKDAPQKVKQVLQRYKKLGMPAQNGLYECGILFRRHHQAEIMRAMELWWAEIAMGTQSDQIPWAFVVWKTGLKPYVIEDDLRKSPYFEYEAHEMIKWANYANQLSN